MLFDWSERKVCGETEAIPCVVKDVTASGKALVVTDGDSNCDKDLIGPNYPSIPVASSDKKTQLRSGSSLEPIKLPKLIQQLGGPFNGVMFQRPDGTVVHWKPTEECNNYRLIIENGMVTVVPDENSNIFNESCEGTVDQITHIAGATEFVDCNGHTKFRLTLIPKDDICVYCS